MERNLFELSYKNGGRGVGRRFLGPRSFPTIPLGWTYACILKRQMMPAYQLTKKQRPYLKMEFWYLEDLWTKQFPLPESHPKFETRWRS